MEAPQEDSIVPISKAREKFFGTSGRMLCPSPATVEAVIKKVPKQKLITTNLIRETLAEEFEVEACCPVTTQRSLRAIVKSGSKAPHWRVVNKSGELFSYYPEGAKGHAALLKKEGYAVDTRGKKPKVKKFEERLVRLK
jgi:hypothetical protein